MLKQVIRQVVTPLISRVGTAAAAFVIGSLAANPDQAAAFGSAVAALLGITVDLLADAWLRRKAG